jgi:hypothetical protein
VAFVAVLGNVKTNISEGNRCQKNTDKRLASLKRGAHFLRSIKEKLAYPEWA